MRRQRRPRRRVVDGRPVRLLGHGGGGRRPVGGRGGGQQHRPRNHGPAQEAGEPPGRDGRGDDRQREQHQRLHGHRRPEQPSRTSGPPVGQGQDGQQQQADGHGVLGMAPPRRHVPQRHGADRGQQRALGPAHAQPLGDRVGGEQRHRRQRDLVGPGHEPRGRIGVVHARHPQRQPGRADRHGHRNQDHGRAGKPDQGRGTGIQAAQVQMREPLGRDQRPPQVIRKRPVVPAHQARPDPDRRHHPGHDQPHRGQGREQPPDQPRHPHRQWRRVIQPRAGRQYRAGQGTLASGR